MRKILNSVKKFLASPKTRAVALMLLVGGTAAFAQSTAGDYTAGTNALTTVAEEIAKYVTSRSSSSSATPSPASWPS